MGSLAFDELPDPKRVWIGSPGSHEEGLGRLSLLTDERVRKAAATQIKTGRRVGLNWDLTKLEYPGMGRAACKHEIVPLMGGVAFDDVYTMNPQQSSQWDGLRHWGRKIDSVDGSTQRIFYGGTTKEEILDRSNDRIGLQHWAREGITGRGVLLDYASWAAENGIQYSAFSDHAIKLEVLERIAEQCGVVFEKGDILLVRSGVTQEWDEKMGVDEKKAYSTCDAPQHVGVEATTEMLRWIWNTGFAAVAGDAISFEVYPPKGDSDIMLHDYLLAGWGMPIGEMFDLEGLARLCKEQGRYTFFFTSMPLNMPGGISSPPNAQAIF